MKKVLFVVPSLGIGGMERVLVNYANLLQQRGYDVTVINLTSDEKAITDHLHPSISYHPNYLPVKHFLHASIKDYLRGRVRLLPWSQWIDFHSAKYLHRKYIIEHYDVEVAFFGMASIKIISGADREMTQTFAWIHGEQKVKDYAPIKNFDDAVNALANIDKCICVSERAKKTLESVYKRKDKTYVINNPNDTKKIREMSIRTGAPPKERFTFVNASRFDDKQKGYSRLLRVCKRLNNEGYTYDLWLVGDGIDYHKIHELADSLNLSNVSFLGQQENPYKFIVNADMYLCASFSEGFSMVMMESIILAVPVITTDVPGAAEMLDNGKYGMIVENTEEGLYQGMKKILTNHDLYLHYRLMAEKRKDYLSEEVIMDQLEELFA